MIDCDLEYYIERLPAPESAPISLTDESFSAAFRSQTAFAKLPVALKEGAEIDGAYLAGDGEFYSPHAYRSYQIAGLRAGSRAGPCEKVIYINGISTTADRAFDNMWQISRGLRAEVVCIYNATEGDIEDVTQAIGDKFGIGANPAVSSTAGELEQALRGGERLHFVVESHGAIIFSRAAAQAIRNLESEFSPEELQARLSLIRVETFGGAAWSFPDGPQYIHYINDSDPVPFRFGLGGYGLSYAERTRIKSGFSEPDWMRNLGRICEFAGIEELARCNPGANARIIRFHTEQPAHWIRSHAIPAYMDERIDFEAARSLPLPQAAPVEAWPLAKLGLQWLLAGGALWYACRLMKSGLGKLGAQVSKIRSAWKRRAV